MATAAPTAAEAPPPKGKKKLIILIAVAVLVLALGGVAAMLLLKKPAPVEGEDGEPVAADVKHDAKSTPVFVPLDPFTVNLADREAERYAQVGITLEITDTKTGDQIKAFMPAIRNNILMTIADRTAVELSGREGKVELAEKIRREASRAMGVEVEDEDPAADEADAPKKKKSRKKAQVLPIKAVHFSNFIIQ